MSKNVYLFASYYFNVQTSSLSVIYFCFTRQTQSLNTAVRRNESESIQLHHYSLNGVHILAISNVKVLDFGFMRFYVVNYMHIAPPTSAGTISGN